MSDRSPYPATMLLVGLIALVAAGKVVLYGTIDPDAFWHLRVADQLMRDGVRPLVDEISFASIRTPWTPYSWLAELGMRAIWDMGGYRLAVAIETIVAAGIVAMIGLGAHHAQGRHPNPLAIVLATAVGAFWAMPYLSFRPVTFAILLLGIVAVLLIRDRTSDERTHAIWWIVPITALLANIHLVVIVVPIWIASLFAGAIWDWQRSPNDPNAARHVRRYAILFVATGVACCATPLLPGVIASAVRYGSADPMVKSNFISEMQPFYRGTMGMIAAGFVVLLLACVIARRSRLRVGDWLWLAASMAMLLRLGRFSPIFALAAAPLLAAVLPALSDRPLRRPILRYALAAMLLVGIVRVGWALPSRSQSLDDWLERLGPDTPGYPTAAARFVDEHVTPSTHKLVNEFVWGGYLSWRLGSTYQVLMDGRTQLYTPTFWESTYLGTAEQRRAYLASIVADAAIVPATHSQFIGDLIMLGWTVAHEDGRAAVLLPPGVR